MKRINRVFWILFSVALFFALVSAKDFTVHAATTTGVTGECEWSLDGTVLTISGNGLMGSGSSPWGTSITKVIIKEGVKNIGSYAFYDCTNLKEVSISNTVETIESEAFHWCSNLEEVILSEGLKKIGTQAFVQCHKLKRISIPASVTTMGTNPFQWCSSLTSISVAEGNPHFFSEGNCLIERSTGILISGCENSVIPENAGIKEIGYNAFSSIEGLEEVIIPYGVERINEYAFWSCENLAKVEIPETVQYIHPDALRFLDLKATVTISEDNKTYHSSGNCIIETDSKTIIAGYSNSTIPADDSVAIIGDSAFYGSMALIDLFIPDNITAIGDDAFVNCRNLVNIHIGKGVADISNRAFYYCRSLETISVDPDNPRYCAVGNCLIDTQTKTLLRGTKKSVIPADGSVATIGEYAFYVIDIPLIKLPEGVTEIKEWAVTGIAEIELPNSLRTVHANAFGACDELERVLYNGTIDERDRIQFLDDGYGNENLLSVQWQYGKEWADSGIEFFVKDLQVMEKRDSYSPGDDDLYYERYSINPEFEIRFNDGTVFKSEDYQDALWELEKKTGKSIHFYDNQSFAKQWHVGEHTVTAYFMGEITEFTVTVVENPIKSIEVEPVVCIENYNGYWDGRYDDNGNYVSNSWFRYNDDPQKVTVKFKDGSNISGMWYDVEDQISKQYGGYGSQWSNQDYNIPWSIGEHTGYLALLGIVTEYTVEVRAKSVTSIAVTSPPTKLVYLEGESFDEKGMTVTAYFNNNTDVIVADYTISGFSSTIGKKTVTVSYAGQTASFEITVICRKHTYTNACDVSCDACDWNRAPQAHIFTNNCDTTCNECGKTRVVSDHIYTNAHDSKCNECGDIREFVDCVFTNSCDTKCNICGDIRTITHDYADATCTTPQTCKVCGATSGSVLAHTYDKQVAVDKYLKYAATCSSAAVYYKSCECGAKGASTFTTGSKLSHQSDAGTVTKKATCTATGTKTFKCTLCKATIKTDTIAKVAHKYDSGKVTKTATCKATGVKTYTCSVCKGTKTETIAKLTTHTYSNNCDKSCNVCGKTRTVGPHKYSNACDTTCNTCGAKRTIKHTYTNACDTSCNVCKATRIITHSYKTTTTKATLSKNGSIVKKCTVCGKVASNTAIKYAKSFKLSATSYTYNGKVKTPTVTVKDSAGKTLKKNTDYTVTYAAGRKSAGTYKVTIKMKGNYSGTKTLTFKINPIDISKCSVKLSASSYTYSGKVKTPSVTVKNANGTKLTKNTHYTVTYASGRKNVGTYKVTIKMKGNYTGTKTLTFKIVPKAASINKLTAKTKALTVKLNRSLQQSTGYQIQYATNKNFTSAKTKVLSDYKTGNTTLTGLKAKTTYFVRVRTYKKIGSTTYYSSWSSYKYLKTK